MTEKKKIHIGTSGWHYKHWKGAYYPEDMDSAEFLQFYMNDFHTAEINNSFYQLPEKKTLKHWRETVGDSFIFSVKASRYITHMKKLKDPKDAVSKFMDRIVELRETLGPILFQLPPKWGCNPERLESFLAALPSGKRYAFEFRDESWFDNRVYEILTDHNAAFCIYDYDRRLSPKKVTSDFVYIRLHGPDGPYQGQYSIDQLKGWAGAIAAWAKQGKDIFCYFDNDQVGYAAQDARKLAAMFES